MNGAKSLLNFIIDLQDKEPFGLEEYPEKLLVPLNENFVIGNNETEKLIKMIVDWERFKYPNISLERLLKENFLITKK